MPYDDTMLLQAREQYLQQAAPAPAQGPSASAAQGQPTVSAQPNARTNPLAQANTDAPTGWLGAVDARLDRRFPLLSALAGNDKTVADVNARAAELKDERTAKTFASFGRGIQSQLSRAYADRLSDAQMKALHGSKAVEDMAIMQTIMQMAPDIMREVADEQTWHLFDSNDRHPNLDAAQRLLFNYGYRFGMDDKSNIYVESLDGKTQFLLDDNGIRTLLDAAQANLRNTVDMLASQDPKNASCLPQGQALMAIQKHYTEAGAGLEEASKMAKAAYEAVMGTSAGSRFEALSSFDSLMSSLGNNLEQILASGQDGLPMLGNNGAILVAQMQRNLARDGVEVVPDGNGGLKFIINNRAYGIENGVYNMGQFHDRLKQAEEADPNSVSNVTKRSSEEWRAKKATQELADAINRDALEQKQQLLNEQNAKSEAQRNAYLELAVEMGLVNEDSLASLSDEQKDALIAQVQMEQQQKQAKQDADYEQRKRALALQNMEADLQNKQNRGAGGTGKGKEDGTGNETAGETKVLTPEEKSMNLASKYGDNIYKLKPSAREQVFNLDSSIDKKAEKDGFTDKDGNPNIEAIYNPENFDKFSQFIAQVKQIEAEIKERLDGVTAVPKNPYIKLYEAVSRDRGYALLHRDSVDNVGKVKEMRAQRRRLEEMYREVFDDKDPAGLVEIEDPARLSDNELVERLLAPKSTGLPMKVDIDMPKEGRGPFLSSPGKGPRPYFLALREEAEKYRAMMDDRQKRRNKIWRQAEKLGAKRPSRQEGKGK